MKHVHRFLNEEHAEDLIEYGLLAAFVAAIGTACVVKDPAGLVKAVKHIYKHAEKLIDKA